jgi:L-ribulokinase
VPDGIPTSLGSGIFALVAAGAFPSIEAAQDKLCLGFRTYTPQPEAYSVYNRLFALYRKVYFGLGTRNATPVALGDVLPELRKIAAEVQRTSQDD